MSFVFSVYFVRKTELKLMLILLKNISRGAMGGANEALIPLLNYM